MLGLAQYILLFSRSFPEKQPPRSRVSGSGVVLAYDIVGICRCHVMICPPLEFPGVKVRENTRTTVFAED